MWKEGCLGVTLQRSEAGAVVPLAQRNALARERTADDQEAVNRLRPGAVGLALLLEVKGQTRLIARCLHPKGMRGGVTRGRSKRVSL